MEYTTKPVKLGDRMKINDSLFNKEMFSSYVIACRNGLDTLNGEQVTQKNVDEKINELDTDEIMEIGDKIIMEMNFPKKKKSK